MFSVVYRYQRLPPIPPGRLAAPLVSMVFTEPPPPEPSMMRMIGRRKSCAISSAISGFAEIEASAEPPRTVKSSPTTTTVRPSILPRPNTQFAGVRLVSSPLASYSATPEIAPISWKVFGSTSLSIRSRTVSRPWSRWRLTLSTPPISRANASRRARSSSSGFQFIRTLRRGDLDCCGLSPDAADVNSTMRNKIPLAEQATSGNLLRQQAVREDSASSNGAAENGMPEIRVVTEVAGRVCALPLEAGARVNEGDDIAVVEAMKMEIPIASPRAGKLKSLLVKIDDVVAEGQVVAVVET